MVACGVLEHIFQHSLPQTPTLLDTLTSPNKSIPPIGKMKTTLEVVQAAQKWSLRPSRRARLCLVSESCDDAGDHTAKYQMKKERQSSKDKTDRACGIVNEKRGNVHGELKVVRPRRSNSARDLPPPISCIGRCGKPLVSFKSYRHDGRFVLKQVRTPMQELLHAFREDGRLRLQFMLPIDNQWNNNDLRKKGV